VQEVLKLLFGIGPQSVSLETKAFDKPGWDSVGHLSVCGALEETLEIQFNTSELAEMDSVRSIISVVERKKGRLPDV
jgi:acyl carrier protein